jgi:glycosyltransferase domain-containing protein
VQDLIMKDGAPALGDQLTVLLPLKGRDLHTLRFLYYADRSCLPFPILIADGWVNPRLAALLEEKPHIFPNIRYTYVRYPNDESLSHFYRKMLDIAARVETPYAVQADNDDFLCGAGLERCVEFLNSAPTHAMCGGGVGGFATRALTDATWDKIAGRIDYLKYSYPGHNLSIDAESDCVTERILDTYRRRNPFYYDVFRADVLKTIKTEIAEFAPSDSMIHERFFDLRALTLGKRKKLPGIFTYMRQTGTSLRLTSGQDDIVSRLLRSAYMQDYERMAARIAVLCDDADGGTDRARIADELLRIFEGVVRRRLHNDFAPTPFLRPLLAPLVPEWLRRLRNHGHLTVSGMRREMFRQLRADGADQAYLARFAQEMKLLSTVLEGKVFEPFVREHAPFLLEVP